ncbi:MAG: cysteine synthase A [Desulfovibrionaceae bacterium]
MYTSILNGIGNTPLLRLRWQHVGDCAEICVKLECRSAGSSIKDRIALYMVERALERGTVTPGGTLVEPTSGNTGIGLAIVARAKGLKCILTMPESMSLERRKLLAGFGATLVLTPAAQGMAGAVAEAERIQAHTAGAVILGQFTNPDVVDAHYMSTGPEIFAETGANIAALVAGVGTGGTITGAGRFLKEHVPGIEIIAVEPAASPLLSQGKAGPHPIQGIGANFVPEVLDRALLDRIITVSGDDAFATARSLMAAEGINGGISSGANVWAALQVAREPRMAGKRIVTFICDTGERYLSTPLFAEA